MNEPICADCAFLVGVRSSLSSAKEWKCGHESNPRSKDPVSGSTVYEMTCYQARTPGGFCMPEGKCFKLYEHPEHTLLRRSAALPSADNLLGELGL